NELGEKDVFVFDTDAALMQRLRLGLHDGVQHHSPIVGQERSAAFKERWISSNAKMFECADADDAIHRFIKLFPPLQPHINEASGGGIIVKRALNMVELIAAER